MRSKSEEEVVLGLELRVPTREGGVACAWWRGDDDDDGVRPLGYIPKLNPKPDQVSEKWGSDDRKGKVVSGRRRGWVEDEKQELRCKERCVGLSRVKGKKKEVREVRSGLDWEGPSRERPNGSVRVEGFIRESACARVRTESI